jgi:hypothetical protein
MALDIQPKKASSDTVAPNESKMPKYEYQKNDHRSFSVGYRAPGAQESGPSQSENGDGLKVF